MTGALARWYISKRRELKDKGLRPRWYDRLVTLVIVVTLVIGGRKFPFMIVLFLCLFTSVAYGLIRAAMLKRSRSGKTGDTHDK